LRSPILPFVAFFPALALGACAAAPPPPPAAPPPAPVVLVAAVVAAPPPPAPADETPAATCEKPDGAADDAKCFPSEAYREWLCGRGDPGAAVALFHKGGPWTRAYLARDVESWDPSRRSKRSHLAFDEEVIVLHPNKPSGDVVVVGATNALGWTSLDAVRADGTCVSLMADEITMKRPPAPKHATIAWEKLPERTRTELLASPELRKKGEQMTKACAKAALPQCAKAKSQLTDAVVSLQATPAPTQD
jgi:hypothetical protein